MELVLGIILLVAAIFLIVAVLMQHGKSKNLSGTIAGGSETFFGKSKSQTIDKKLSKLTTVVSIIFVVLVLVVYVVQENIDYNSLISTDDTSSDVGADEDTAADVEVEVDADDVEVEVEVEAEAETEEVAE